MINLSVVSRRDVARSPKHGNNTAAIAWLSDSYYWFSEHVYELADPAGPLEYFGYAG